MEKEKFYIGEEGSTPIWNSCNFGMEMLGNEVNNGNCFLNPNWDNSMDQSDPFESALSSIVSSPAASSANVSNANGIPTGCGGSDSVMIRELIGRLGSICNSGEISPQSYMNNNSTNTSCYSTPLNSPPKLNLSMMDSSQIRGNLSILGNNFGNHPSLAPFPADPAFVERAARYSCFGSRNLGQLGLNETEFPHRLMPRISSNQSMKVSAGSQVTTVQESNKDDGNLMSSDKKKFSKLSRSSTPEKNAEVGDSREESSVSEQIQGVELSKKSQNDAPTGRKRKSIPKGKAKETPSSSPAASDAKENEASAKRSKSEEGNGNEKEAGKTKEDQNGNQKQNKDNPKPPEPPEPPKDYIHVRARRGQATDSHSLAERVRREKISERMKFLQDLVPGCNKVTGKAVMLDEIINYVQSLQRQVEFLSMKLSTVNPRRDFSIESLLSKDSFQSHGSMQQHNLSPLDSSVSAFHYGYQPQHGLSLHNGMSANAENQLSMNSLSALLRRNPHMQLPPLDGFADAARQMGFGEDDLQSVVQMGFVPNQQQSFHGSVPSAQMKVEL